MGEKLLLPRDQVVADLDSMQTPVNLWKWRNVLGECAGLSPDARNSKARLAGCKSFVHLQILAANEAETNAKARK